jgi:hypothetical protein
MLIVPAVDALPLPAAPPDVGIALPEPAAPPEPDVSPDGGIESDSDVS